MKFWIHTYGCQMNVRDSEAVEALLEAAGHEKAAGEGDADVVIVRPIAAILWSPAAVATGSEYTAVRVPSPFVV